MYSTAIQTTGPMPNASGARVAANRVAPPKWLRIGLMLVVFSYATEGPLRLGLMWAGVSPLLYLRDLLLVATVVYAMLAQAVSKQVGTFWAVLLLVGVHGLVGLLQTPSVLQVAFGLKIFLPVLAGMVGAKVLFKEHEVPSGFFALLWVIGCVGIAADYFLDLPWTGLSYALFGQEIEGSRLWWTGGMQRLNGFSRFSWDTAAQIQLAAVFLMFARMSWVMKALVWLLTGFFVVLTTTKGLIVAWALCSLALFAQAALPKQLDIRKTMLAAIACIGISLPFAGEALRIEPTGGDLSYMLLYSMEDRMTSTWPEAMQIYQSNHPLLGGGLGAIGTPQKYYGQKINPADNFFLYLVCTFGLAALAYYGFVAKRCLRLHKRPAVASQAFSYVAITIFAAGCVVNVVESTFLALFLGFLIGHLVET